MEYEIMIPPFKHDGFEHLNRKQAEEYFQWYMSQIDYRIKILSDAVSSSSVLLDFTVDSLIDLWEWYEDKIIVEKKTEEELKEEVGKYPSWMEKEISTTKISLDTWKIGMDVAIYFAEVFRKAAGETIYWGYFTKPKKRASVNQPVLLGFKKEMDLDARRVVVNCTRHSSEERKKTRLYDMVNVWMKYI